MKKLSIILAMVFALLISPLTTDAAVKNPTRYEQYTFTSSKVKVELQVRLANEYATKSFKYYNKYLDTQKKGDKKQSQGDWKRAMNSLENSAQNMKVALELQKKYNLDKNFGKWQEKQYEAYDVALVNTLDAYRAQLRLVQLDSDIKSRDLQYQKILGKKVYLGEYGDVFDMYLGRTLKGWNDGEAYKNIHTIIDTILSPRFDNPIDVLSGFTVELTTQTLFDNYFKGTAVQENEVIKRIPSAIGNTMSVTTIGNPKYAYETQIKLLAIQLDLIMHMDDIFGDLTQLFDDYSSYVASSEKKKAEDAKRAAEEEKRKAEEQEIQCDDGPILDSNYFLNCRK